MAILIKNAYFIYQLLAYLAQQQIGETSIEFLNITISRSLFSWFCFVIYIFSKLWFRTFLTREGLVNTVV